MQLWGHYSILDTEVSFGMGVGGWNWVCVIFSVLMRRSIGAFGASGEVSGTKYIKNILPVMRKSCITKQCY